MKGALTAFRRGRLPGDPPTHPTPLFLVIFPNLCLFVEGTWLGRDIWARAAGSLQPQDALLEAAQSGGSELQLWGRTARLTAPCPWANP